MAISKLAVQADKCKAAIPSICFESMSAFFWTEISLLYWFKLADINERRMLIGLMF